MELTMRLVRTWTILAESPFTMIWEASNPFFSLKSISLLLALGSRLSIVSRMISSKSKGTNSMSSVPDSILVMTSKSSNNPAMRSTFFAALRRICG